MSDTPTFSVYVRGEMLDGSVTGGVWVDLDHYETLSDFLGAVMRAANYAPVIFFTTYENAYGVEIPEYYSFVDIWDIYQEFQRIDADRREAFADYLALVGGVERLKYALETFDDAYEGRYESLEDFAWEYASEAYPQLFQLPPGFRAEVDLTAWEQDFWISDNGHVFQIM